ncbi:oxetanocin A resistance protein [Desulfosporosinus metallidurans]|uniref:Oxetanocin A resistance protein n=1 Tax=Desulfosporosinus metallidurans TaxID=1888891 RepID=A0A1Q8QJ70_9FIRM|nr:oxetanocin A resistance protein [Desulfosporosinus metallidurans]
MLDETERLSHLSPDSLMELDVAVHRENVNTLLLKTSELVRAEARRGQKVIRGGRRPLVEERTLPKVSFSLKPNST